MVEENEGDVMKERAEDKARDGDGKERKGCCREDECGSEETDIGGWWWMLQK